MTIVILRPFLQALPDELEEAAAARRRARASGSSGGSWCRCPGPGLVTVGVLAFVGSWNAYLLPLLLLSDPR